MAICRRSSRTLCNLLLNRLIRISSITHARDDNGYKSSRGFRGNVMQSSNKRARRQSNGKRHGKYHVHVRACHQYILNSL